MCYVWLWSIVENDTKGSVVDKESDNGCDIDVDDADEKELCRLLS